MISTTTPDKLAEILRDTWPNLYRPSKDHKVPSGQESHTYWPITLKQINSLIRHGYLYRFLKRTYDSLNSFNHNAKHQLVKCSL